MSEAKKCNVAYGTQLLTETATCEYYRIFVVEYAYIIKSIICENYTSLYLRVYICSLTEAMRTVY